MFKSPKLKETRLGYSDKYYPLFAFFAHVKTLLDHYYRLLAVNIQKRKSPHYRKGQIRGVGGSWFCGIWDSAQISLVYILLKCILISLTHQRSLQTLQCFFENLQNRRGNFHFPRYRDVYLLSSWCSQHGEILRLCRPTDCCRWIYPKQ